MASLTSTSTAAAAPATGANSGVAMDVDTSASSVPAKNADDPGVASEPDKVQADQDVDFDQQAVKDEFNVWKKNVPYLYDIMLTHALEWPSLTCEWLPSSFDAKTDASITRKLLLGTHTSEGAANELLVTGVTLPKEGTDWMHIKEDGEPDEANSRKRVQIEKRFPHEGEVNRARHCKANPNLVATKSPTGNIYIYDVSKESGTGPVSTCHGHSDEGFGISWGIMGSKADLLSAGNDGLICLWKVTGNVKKVAPYGVFKGHSTTVEDVSWSCANPHTFVSVGDDKALIFWDTRQREAANIVADAHYTPINCVDCHPSNTTLLLTGGADGSYRLWDTRTLSASKKKPIHSMPRCHDSDVLSLQWNPSYDAGFVSTGADRRVMMHDLSRIGEEQERDDAADGPPEMLFIHSGHTGRVEDSTLREGDGWLCASVSDDNIVQVWNMSRKIYERGDDFDEDVKKDMDEVMNAPSGEP